MIQTPRAYEKQFFEKILCRTMIFISRCYAMSCCKEKLGLALMDLKHRNKRPRPELLHCNAFQSLTCLFRNVAIELGPSGHIFSVSQDRDGFPKSCHILYQSAERTWHHTCRRNTPLSPTNGRRRWRGSTRKRGKAPRRSHFSVIEWFRPAFGTRNVFSQFSTDFSSKCTFYQFWRGVKKSKRCNASNMGYKRHVQATPLVCLYFFCSQTAFSRSNIGVGRSRGCVSRYRSCRRCLFMHVLEHMAGPDYF